MLREAVGVPAEIGQRELRRIERAQPVPALRGGGAQAGDALLDVERERALEERGEGAQVEAVVTQQPVLRAQRHAGVAAAETRRLETPAERSLYDVGREPHAVGVDDGRHLERAILVEESQGREWRHRRSLQ